MKKLISLIGAGALLLSVATPAFGVTSVTINKAKIKNTTVVKAETGDNYAGNSALVTKAGVSGSNVTADGDNTITTGDAKAKNLGIIAANTAVGCDGCTADGVTVNKAKVRNTTVVKAETGGNGAGNSASVSMAGVTGSNVTADGNNTIDTGNASAKNVGVILVNTQVSFGP